MGSKTSDKKEGPRTIWAKVVTTRGGRQSRDEGAQCWEGGNSDGLVPL